MINGAHVLFYTANPEADRRFFREVLGFPSVDAGGGWLIFALPPTEAAFHPMEEPTGSARAEPSLLGSAVYFMCDDLDATMRELAQKGVRCAAPSREPWGLRTTIPLPSGGEVGLYQPTHPTALGLGSGAR